MNSATYACYMQGIAIKKDKVWVVTNSFVSSANCAAFGADLEFLDINKNDYNVDIDKLKNKLEKTLKKIYLKY